MSQASSPDTPEVAVEPQEIVDFAKSVDSVEYAVVVSDEGFPLAFKGLDQEQAEAAAALAVDLIMVGREMVRDLAGREGKEVIVDIGEGNIIDVARAQDLLTLIRGERKPAEEAMQAIIRKLEGRAVKCPYCGADLTLQVYKCSKCGKTMPFTSPACPHCGAPARFKECPNCGRMTTNDGKKVVEAEPAEARLIAAIEGAMGGVALGVLAYTFTQSLTAMAGGAIVGGLVAGYLAKRMISKEYRVVED